MSRASVISKIIGYDVRNYQLMLIYQRFITLSCQNLKPMCRVKDKFSTKYNISREKSSLRKAMSSLFFDGHVT